MPGQIALLGPAPTEISRPLAFTCNAAANLMPDRLMTNRGFVLGCAFQAMASSGSGLLVGQDLRLCYACVDIQRHPHCSFLSVIFSVVCRKYDLRFQLSNAGRRRVAFPVRDVFVGQGVATSPRGRTPNEKTSKHSIPGETHDPEPSYAKFLAIARESGRVTVEDPRGAFRCHAADDRARSLTDLCDAGPARARDAAGRAASGVTNSVTRTAAFSTHQPRRCIATADLPATFPRGRVRYVPEYRQRRTERMARALRGHCVISCGDHPILQRGQYLAANLTESRVIDTPESSLRRPMPVWSAKPLRSTWPGFLTSSRNRRDRHLTASTRNATWLGFPTVRRGAQSPKKSRPSIKQARQAGSRRIDRSSHRRRAGWRIASLKPISTGSSRMPRHRIGSRGSARNGKHR